MPIKWNCVSNRRIGLNPSFRGNCRSQIKEYAFWFWFGRRCKRGFKAFLSYGRKLCFAGTLCAAYIEFKVGSLVLYLIVSVYNAHIELHWKIGWHWPRLRWPVRCTQFQFQLLLLIRPLAGPSLRWFSVSISIFSFPLTLAWLMKRTLVNFNSYHSHVGRWLADCPALSFRFVYLHNKQISKCKTVEFVAGPALRWTSVSFSILSFGWRILRRDIITRTYSIRVF